MKCPYCGREVTPVAPNGTCPKCKAAIPPEPKKPETKEIKSDKEVK